MAPVPNDGSVDLKAWTEADRARIVKLADERLNIPAPMPYMEGHNTWCANVPGSTLIWPVADVAQHVILLLLYLVQNGTGLYDDVNGRQIPGLEKFSHRLNLTVAYPRDGADAGPNAGGDALPHDPDGSRAAEGVSYVTGAMLPLNALGNQVLMHGFGSVPAFEPTGAGLSTLIVATTGFLNLVVIARRSVPRTEAERGFIGWSDLAPVLRVGLPIGIATVAELGIFLGATLYAATLGPADVAAHTLTRRIAGVAYAVPAALLQAAMVRMARAEAQADPGQSWRVVRSALWLTTISGVSTSNCRSKAFDTTSAGFPPYRPGRRLWPICAAIPAKLARRATR